MGFIITLDMFTMYFESVHPHHPRFPSSYPQSSPKIVSRLGLCLFVCIYGSRFCIERKQVTFVFLSLAYFS
jgi:hypothetical protein